MHIRDAKIFYVGDWRVTPDEDTVSRDGHAERLEPLAMQVLVYLASRSGEVVSRSDLEQTVWKGGVVSHDSEALDIFLIGATKNYNYIPTQVWLAATYAKLGDPDEDEWAAEQIRTLMPDFTIDEWMRHRPYKKLEHRDALTNGLKLAGLK